MRNAVSLFLGFAFVACTESARLPVEAGMGPHPTLPPPNPALIPTFKIAPAKGWPPNTTPVAAPGLSVTAFATGLDHPRWLYVLPNGDVLVAKTNAPPKPDDNKGIKGWFKNLMSKRAGAAVKSANRITLLRDADGDGRAETRTVFLQDLNSPFGMTLTGNDFYVADSDALLRFSYANGTSQIRTTGRKIVDLPAGSINHHWTKNVIASRDGSRLYVTVGSNSNAGENGLANETNRAAIWEVDPATGPMARFRVRPSQSERNGMGAEERCAVDRGQRTRRNRSDLVPDYMTAVKGGGFYGWPFSYYGQHVDSRVKEQRPDLVAKALVPDFALGSHTACLGLTFYEGSLLHAHYAGGAFVGQHGSWNRKPLSGYKVIFVPFTNGQPSGMPEDVLTGFVDAQGNALGRPVGVAVDRIGALLVADDVGNTVWRITPK